MPRPAIADNSSISEYYHLSDGGDSEGGNTSLPVSPRPQPNDPPTAPSIVDDGKTANDNGADQKPRQRRSSSRRSSSNKPSQPKKFFETSTPPLLNDFFNDKDFRLHSFKATKAGMAQILFNSFRKHTKSVDVKSKYELFAMTKV